MTKFSISVLSVLFVLLISSCRPKEDGVGDLILRFKLVYGDKPLEMFKNYNFPVSNETFFMTRMSFFISDITATSGQESYTLKDVDYINLTQSHSNGDNALEYTLKGILAKDYDKLSFGIGLPERMNNLQPKDFKSTHILSNTTEYWSGWKSYIFFRPEGRIAINSSEPNVSFGLHLGSNNAYKYIELPKKFTIQDKGTTEVEILVDIEKFFNSTHLFDIKSKQQLHSLNDLPTMMLLVDNLVNVFR